MRANRRRIDGCRVTFPVKSGCCKAVSSWIDIMAGVRAAADLVPSRSSKSVCQKRARTFPTRQAWPSTTRQIAKRVCYRSNQHEDGGRSSMANVTPTQGRYSAFMYTRLHRPARLSNRHQAGGQATAAISWRVALASAADSYRIRPWAGYRT